MAFTGDYMCTSFKQELLVGTHDFTNGTGNTFKLALYDNTASFTAATTAYTTPDSSEITGTNYTQGGNALTNVTPTTSGTTALTDFADETFSNVTISGVRGSLIYNSSASDRAVIVNDFGSDKSATSGDFTIVFPTADASNAIIRIA